MASFEEQSYHDYNIKYHFGMSDYRLKRWIGKHRNGTPEQKKWIEDMLDDCNFHHESSMLSWGEYDELIEEIKGWYK